MINYEYESLFENHFAVNFLIVDSGATVTINAGIFPTVSDAKFEITNTELKAESININESICSNNNLTFGKMESSKITFTLRSDADIQENLADEEIDVYLFFNLDSSTLFKVGRYIVTSDKYTSDRMLRNITAYDILYFLKDYDITKWYNATLTAEKKSIATLRNSLFTWLAAEGFNITQETTTLVNDLLELPNNIESDLITFEFFMSKILEINGCFGHINREGVFTYKTINWYDSHSVTVLENSDREPTIQYEPYTVKGIGIIRAYDRDNIKLGEVGSSNFKRPNIYSITDSFVIDAMKTNGVISPIIINGSLQKMLNKVTHLRYTPMTVKALGNLCLEVGDKIDIQYGVDGNGDPVTFYTYILDRKFKGINAMRDTYSAKGDQIQPEYVVTENWHQGDSELATSGEGNEGISEIFDEHDQHFCEIIRNVQQRVLDEPSNVQAEYDDGDMIAKFKWTDPADLVDQAPITCTWAGTKVIRKENEKPYNIYDGDIIADVTTRDAYEDTFLEDNTIEEDKRYYYGIFPYDTNGNVRFTKVLSVNTTKFAGAPVISSILQENNDTIINYSIPSGTYTYIKLVYKINSIPANYTDGTAIDITQESTSQNVGGLANGVKYWFVIFTNKTSSEPVSYDCYISGMIRNIIIPGYNQSLALDNSLWTDDWDSGRLSPGALPSKFTLSNDFLNKLMYATVETESVLIYEKNGVQIYGMRDAKNATYGGYYKYSVYIKDNGVIVAGSQYPGAYYSQAWYVASGFDKRDNYYNSNVWSRIQALYLGFGVDDDAHLGYLIGCAKWHLGYYQGAYINYDSYTSKKISNNTGQYGAYCNSAKLYDALIKLSK